MSALQCLKELTEFTGTPSLPATEPHDPALDVAPPKNPPAFNIPRPVLFLALVLIGVHWIRIYMLDAEWSFWVIGVFAFIPAAYHALPSQLFEPLSIYWTPITHGLLHADWTHLLSNLLWFVAFGSAVAKRFAAPRFWIFMITATAAGAGAHYLAHPEGLSPVIGASGAVSACMGVAVRFAFVPGKMGGSSVHGPALSLIQSLMNKNTLIFIGLWFALNFLLGAGIIPLAGDAQIAWEAHMGGFLLGWLGFALFDRPKNQGRET